MKCLFCKKSLEGNQEKYCSEKCKRIIYYYSDRDKRIKRQRVYDKTHKEKKKEYDKKRRKVRDYNLKKSIQHHSQRYHFPILFKKHGGCQLKLNECLKNERLEIHHIKYTKDINDCMLLCQNCHKKIHRKLYKV